MSVASEMTQRLLNAAVAFYQAGARCHAVWEVTPVHWIRVGAPTVVNFAFSIELYLKLALLLTTNTYPKGVHELLTLYQKLDASTQALMQKHSKCPGDPNWVPEKMAEISNAFIKWRYAHEEEFLMASPDAMREIAYCLHRTAQEVEPTLISAYERL